MRPSRVLQKLRACEVVSCFKLNLADARAAEISAMAAGGRVSEDEVRRIAPLVSDGGYIRAAITASLLMSHGRAIWPAAGIWRKCVDGCSVITSPETG